MTTKKTFGNAQTHDIGIRWINHLLGQAILSGSEAVPKLEPAKNANQSFIERSQWGFCSPGLWIFLIIRRFYYRTPRSFL